MLHYPALSRLVRSGPLLALAMLAGCAGTPDPQTLTSDPVVACRAFIDDFEHAVARHDVGDARSYRIKGFDTLRVNRFLADQRRRIEPDSREFRAWADALQALGEQGHLVELANLPPASRQRLAEDWRGVLPGDGLADQLSHCGRTLMFADIADPGDRERLLAQAEAGNEYSRTRRVLGLYYLTALGVNPGVNGWHEESTEVHRTPPEALAIHGDLVRYEPPDDETLTQAAVASLLTDSKDRLGRPRPRGAQRERLFNTFAPAWEVDVVTEDDRIGVPFWPPGADTAQVDTQRPRVYRHLSHVRWNHETLLQLNYVVWFPARPRTGVFDYLGGHFDGVIWRVTLAPDGAPLMYDTIHNCGCYHTFYPARPMRVADSGLYYEGAFTPLDEPLEPAGERMVIRLAHRTHYTEHVGGPAAPQARVFVHDWGEYDELRSLPAGDSRRSLFTPQGMVAGTERGERWFLWPMGIANPGAMRQWGRHPTAFIGRRHFDDVDVFERDFEVRE